MFFIKKSILLTIVLSIMLLVNLKADDDGFRITPSIGLDYSYKYSQSFFKPNMDIDITYLFPMRLELGVGAGFMHDILFLGSTDIPISNGITNQEVPYGQIVKESYPAYLVARYSFDFNETDDIVLAFKYGSIFTNSSGESANTAYDMKNIRMISATIGYELDDTIVGVDFRIVKYKQYFYLVDDPASKYENNEWNGYFGIALQHRFNLF